MESPRSQRIDDSRLHCPTSSLAHYLTNLYPFMIPYISASAQPMGMESQIPVTPISGKEERK